jgi:hypothetical protein
MKRLGDSRKFDKGRPLLQNEAFWLIWFACCVFFNFSLGGGIYGSQVLLCILLTVWIFRNLFSGRVFRLLPVLVAVIAFSFWELIVAGHGNFHFLPEISKILLLGLVTVAIRDLIPKEKMPMVLQFVPLFVASQVAFTYFTGAWDYYDPLLHRFGVPALGSPNTTAYVLAFCLIFLHHSLSNSTETPSRVAGIAGYLVIGVALIATQSRGGLLIYFAGLFFISGRKVRFLLLAASGVAIAIMFFSPLGQDISRVNVVMDLRETGGTSRVFIWQQLAQNLLRHPLALITGMGPGATDFYVAESDLPIQSTHSMVVEIIYSYGVFGTAIFFWILTRLWKGANDNSVELRELSLRKALLAALTVSFLLDSYPLTAQILWFTPVMLYIITASTLRSVALQGPVLLRLEKKLT